MPLDFKFGNEIAKAQLNSSLTVIFDISYGYKAEAYLVQKTNTCFRVLQNAIFAGSKLFKY